MFNLDPGKLLIIGVVAMVLLGPDKLPQVARQVGNAWKTFAEFRQRMEAEVRGSIPDLPSSKDLHRLTRSPTALLNHLSKMGDPDAAATIDPEALDDGYGNGNGNANGRDRSPIGAGGGRARANGHYDDDDSPEQAESPSYGDPSLN
jgi:sec-independent protein translocase protein TatB